MSKKLTHEEFLQKLKKSNKNFENIIFITKYENSATLIICKCKLCGREWKVLPSNLIAGKGCKPCNIALAGKHRRLDGDFVKKEFEYVGYILIDEYTGSEIKMRYICKKHPDSIQSIKYSNFRNGNRCPLCHDEKRGLGQKEFEIRANIKNDNIVFSGTYINGKSKIKCECLICGHNWESTGLSISKGIKCPICIGFKITQEIFEERVRKSNPTIKVIGSYTSSKNRVQCECSKCGCNWNPIAADLMYSKNGCPKCKESKYERLVRLYLDSHSVKYEMQYTFDDCIYKKKLPFDFCILNQDGYIKFLIEVQGHQHEKPIRFGGMSKSKAEKNYEENLIRDKIKNQYCIENNIKLIKIWYFDIEKINEMLNVELGITA